MAEGWRRAPARADPVASRWTWQPAETHDIVVSAVPTAPVVDEHPLPSVDPRHPRLEWVLSWIAPWWASRRAAARVARYQHAVWGRVGVAYDDRHRALDLPSRYGPSWRGSRFWHR
jgi:hypothetical protein